MSEPAHYVTSEYYNPGFINEVGFFAAAMVAVVSLFVLTIIGSRYILLTSKRLKPRTRRVLRILGGLARPSRPRRRRREREPEARREREAPFRLKAAPEDARSAPLTASQPIRRERARGGQFSADLSLQPDDETHRVVELRVHE